MLTDLIDEVIRAEERGSKKDAEKAYRNLEKVGVDRLTARVIVKERASEIRRKKGVTR